MEDKSLSACEAFLKARDQLLALHGDYPRAYQEFRPPLLSRFNWALDYFDRLARDNQRTALRVVSDVGLDRRLSFKDLSARSKARRRAAPAEYRLQQADVVYCWSALRRARQTARRYAPSDANETANWTKVQGAF